MKRAERRRSAVSPAAGWIPGRRRRGGIACAALWEKHGTIDRLQLYYGSLSGVFLAQGLYYTTTKRNLNTADDEENTAYGSTTLKAVYQLY
jgi:hypothetical protein